MTPSRILTDDERRRIAGFVLHAYLAGRKLPDHVAGVPESQIVDRLMRADAKEMLETLRDLYGVAWWTREEFERAFVEGALAGWKPDTATVSARGPELRVISTSCPIAAEVDKDRRLCDACQALQRHAAYLAMFGQVEDVAFEQLMSEGDGACELRVAMRR